MALEHCSLPLGINAWQCFQPLLSCTCGPKESLMSDLQAEEQLPPAGRKLLPGLSKVKKSCVLYGQKYILILSLVKFLCMSLFCPVTKLEHWFLSFSKARILRSVSEGFGYSLFMLNSITNICDSLQLIDQQIVLSFLYFTALHCFQICLKC